ncbi:TPA_asm: amino acid permease [Salmonella enterica subsp. houtenae serovar 45:g,z51:-]|uniref:Amino acid permease n=1 Tax=Salmonella enterica subsp. houtenae serovar 45:g,z51:- TaxID=1967611 RepID=A0A701UMG3_SALHO|nr:amino acid permease [Salmonella enterica subsp. houtenae serovar 45:g,z51:-]HAE3152529.1 amino acid permease [Salmonella enterica subsp. houtenae serovar 50:g,z51:-]HAE7578249.1 amino acid permease [Salmonella enterica subsp. houtenae serovar 48:g,z51:-]
MSDTVSYIHAFITLIFCVLCKSTCASLLYEITCDIRKIRRFYAIAIEKIAEIAWLYVTARR